LFPGDVLLTGTPAGVGPVLEGDVIEAGIGELSRISFEVASRQ
jgi:2-keto-4-pentenoate hydratase/2-oxohepta-3-ene-1,7-dioic acid hydratase in catechol pathway